MDGWVPLFVAFHLSIGGSAGLRIPRPDAWFAEDKLKHFFLSMAVTNVAYGAVRTTGVAHGPALVVAGIGAGAAGIGKELVDRSQGKPFSEKDLVWDGLGIGAGLLLAAHSR